jgi:chorismate mutase / prephenate dehydratase
MTELIKLRERIDQLDFQIHDLLNERAKIALQVADAKIAEDAGFTDFYRPERESEILQNISAYNKGPLSDAAVASIFKAIMKECLQIQEERYPKK